MSETAAFIAEHVLPDLLSVAFKTGGWTAVKGLVAAFGGKRIRIPKTKVGDCHPLVVAGGRAAADAIVEQFGNQHAFHFPRGGHSLKLMLVRDADDLSYNKLADLLGCTYSHAIALRKEAKRGKQAPPRKSRRASDPRQIDIEDILVRR